MLDGAVSSTGVAGCWWETAEANDVGLTLDF
jgi:hypothetical protein